MISNIFDKQDVKQISRFLVVGIMNTLFDLLLLNIMTLISDVKDGLGYSAQKTCSAGISIVFSYTLNKHWSFKSYHPGNKYIEFSKFLVISLTSMAIQVIVATVMVLYVRPLLDIHDTFLANPQLWVNIGGISGSLFSAISNFLGYKYIVFERKGHLPLEEIANITEQV